MPEPEVAATCDTCPRPIHYGDIAYAVPAGHDKDGKPINLVICEHCHNR